MKLRDVTLDDLSLYQHMRCDPVMMAELGGPLPIEGVPDKLRRDVAAVERDEYWVSIVESDEGAAMGSVVLWRHDDHGEMESEIGWMVLPAFQGRGSASRRRRRCCCVLTPTGDGATSTRTPA